MFLIDKCIHFIWFGNLLNSNYICKLNKIAKDNNDYTVILWISKNQILQDLEQMGLDSELKLKIYYSENVLPIVKIRYIESLEDSYINLNQGFIFAKAIKYIYLEVTTKSNFSCIYENDSDDEELFYFLGRNYAAGADLARLLVLYIYGGMYSDFDNIFKKRIGNFYIKEKHTKITLDAIKRKNAQGIYKDSYLLNNNILATPSKNEFILEALKVMCLSYDKMYERNYIHKFNFEKNNLFDDLSNSEFKNYKFQIISCPSDLKIFSVFTNANIGVMNKRSKININEYVNITCEMTGPYFFARFILYIISKKSSKMKFDYLNCSLEYEKNINLFNNLVIDSSYLEHTFEHSWVTYAPKYIIDCYYNNIKIK